MGQHRATTAVAAIVLAAAAACTHAPGGTIEGVTTSRVCGGIPDDQGQAVCTTPQPGPAEVIVRRDSTVVARVRSGSDGRFEVTVEPGTYEVTARLDVGPRPACSAETVTVAGAGPAPAVSLVCTYFAP